MKILVVDDDELVRDTIADLLAYMEIYAYKVSSPESVMRLIEENQFDYIFTDILMPGLNGIDLMKKVKEKYPETKFICISGVRDIMSEEVEQLVEISIQKPIDAEKFIKKITRLFRDNN